MSRRPKTLQQIGNLPASPTMATCRATETSCAAALVIEVSTIARPASLAQAAGAVNRRNVGRDARIREARLAVVYKWSESALTWY